MYAHSELPMSIFLSMYLKVLFLNSKEVKTGVLFSSWSLQKRFSLRLSKRYVVYRLCVFVCVFVCFFNAWNFYPWKCRLACEVWAFLTTFSFHTALQRERRASCGTVVHLRACIKRGSVGSSRCSSSFVQLDYIKMSAERFEKKETIDLRKKYIGWDNCSHLTKAGFQIYVAVVKKCKILEKQLKSLISRISVTF